MLGALVLVVASYELWIIGRVIWWRTNNPRSSAFMDAHRIRLQEQKPGAELSHKWVPYGQISIHLKRAVIASEDAKFLRHDGFDWEGIQAAWEQNLRKRRIVTGGSTISQQLAKNLFLSGRRTPWRKLDEAHITIWMELFLSKRRILEIYLNVIEWGDGVFGAEAASRHYYRVSAAKLTARQAAWLAAIVPNPRYHDRNRKDRKAERKTNIILARMAYTDAPE